MCYHISLGVSLLAGTVKTLGGDCPEGRRHRFVNDAHILFLASCRGRIQRTTTAARFFISLPLAVGGFKGQGCEGIEGSGCLCVTLEGVDLRRHYRRRRC